MGSQKTHKEFYRTCVCSGGAIEASEQLRLTRREELLPFPPRGCSLSPPPLPLNNFPIHFNASLTLNQIALPCLYHNISVLKENLIHPLIGLCCICHPGICHPHFCGICHPYFCGICHPLLSYICHPDSCHP